MRAVRFSQFGSPANLVFEDVADLTPSPDEVLVKVAAAAINPSDVKNVQGLMPQTMLPRTPGRDFAGTIAAGPDALVGTEVWGSGGDLGFTRDGTHAEYLLLPRHAVYPKPTHLTMEEAAAVGVPFITAWAGLMDAAEMTAHDTVLVIGAGGAVGSAAVQIADWKGAKVIGVVRREEQIVSVQALCADDVLVLAGGDLSTRIKEATDGNGATLIFDTVGGEMLEPCLQSLASKGRLIEISTGERRVTFDLLDFYRRELRLFGINTLSLDAAAGSRILQALAAGFEAGVLQAPTITARYTLSDVQKAYDHVAQGAGGKVLLLP